MSKSILTHPFPPIFDQSSRILILGSFPSVKSRANQFYYGHPQNRFWPLLARLCKAELPHTNEEKRAFLLAHHIAIWDVAAACTIKGSADNSIDHVTVNDLSPLFQQAPIAAVFTNGQTAKTFYDKHLPAAMPATALPSTSPANGRYNLDKLAAAWQIILPYLY